MHRLSRVALLAALAAGAVPAVLTSASAGPVASADVQVLISARPEGPGGSIPPLFANGSTATVARRSFLAGVGVLNAGPDSATVKVRLELPAGLGWGADGPDPSESCTESPTPLCQVTLSNAGDANGWEWDVVAGTTGSYVVKAEVVESSTPDPNLSDNAVSVTIVMTEAGGGGSGGGSGGGGGGSAAAAASAVKLSPAKPKAGSTVVASVRVTKGGSPLRPTRVACSASIGSAKVKGASKAASGLASCLFKTPKSAKGRTLRGSVSFSADGTTFTKPFAAKLH